MGVEDCYNLPFGEGDNIRVMFNPARPSSAHLRTQRSAQSTILKPKFKAGLDPLTRPSIRQPVRTAGTSPKPFVQPAPLSHSHSDSEPQNPRPPRRRRHDHRRPELRLRAAGLHGRRPPPPRLLRPHRLRLQHRHRHAGKPRHARPPPASA